MTEPVPLPRLRPAVAVALSACVLLSGCQRGEPTLWDAKFDTSAGVARNVASAPEATGYWEGDVSMGGVRMRIEPERVTLALRCDRDGRKVAEAAARTAPAATVAEPGGTSRMTLQEDLAGGDADCGFRFGKGDAFGYTLRGPGVLEVAFAGASVSRLHRLGATPAR